MKKFFLAFGFSCIAMTIMAMSGFNTATAALNLSFENVNAEKPSPFCAAIMKGDMEAVKKMISQGEDVNQKSMGMTPAHYAARYNKPEILELLIQNGANLKKRSDDGYTAKRYAELSNATEAMDVIKNSIKKR
ncbi:MAG: ankyrin repeat domain-containing protein [Bacteroidota bacterium]